MRIRISALLISTQVLISSAALAQSQPVSELEPGTRVRISPATISAAERIGRINSITSDSIRFRSDSDQITRALALRDVGSLEVSTGVQSRSAQYAALGAIAGGLIGYVSSNHDGTGLGTGKTSAGQNAAVGGIAGTVIGGALGWYFGRNRKLEHWRAVDLSRLVR